MYKLYHIINKTNNHYYIGITKNSLERRYSGHLYSVNSGKKSRLYDAMRSYGVDNFYITLVEEFNDAKSCFSAEIEAIKIARGVGDVIYNLSDGGEGGFVVQDIESWKAKLREKRAGKKPALGIKHTEENKKIFSESSNKRWSKCGLYPKEIISKLSLKEAKRLYGISTTHYYRLRHTTGME